MHGGDTMNRLAVILMAILAVPAMALAQSGPKRAPSSVAEPRTVQVPLADAKGGAVGDVRLQETPRGVFMKVTITNLPPGPHAFHIHAVGRCAPTFDAAGDHFNPMGKQHGIENPKGRHAGDLPNLHIPDTGRLVVEVLAPDVTLVPGKANSLLDADGAALVIHAKADDHQSDPAGESGDRIACGAITREVASPRSR
jgi:Cu-Zn family superoxide dismutase